MSPSTSSRRRLAPIALGGAVVLGLALQPAAALGGARVISKEACDREICEQVAVSCEGLTDRVANVRRFDGQGKRGTVIFTTGGNGRGRYNKLPMRKRTQTELLAAGFEVFQVEWLGDEGWVTGAWGSGFSRGTCAYAELVRWIVAERAANPAVVCAQGNSGGSIQSSYGLAVHGLEDLLDMVVMSGGPPVTRLDRYCFEGNDRRAERRGDGPARKIASTGRTLIDQMMGWEGVEDHCKRVEEVPPADVLERVQRDSLVPPFGDVARDYDYPKTKVNFVESVGDDAAAQGRIYFEALQSAKAWHDIPGDVHSVDSTEAGSKKIVELFEAECRAQ